MDQVTGHGLRADSSSQAPDRYTIGKKPIDTGAEILGGARAMVGTRVSV